jgi:predicted transcriptional regulator
LFESENLPLIANIAASYLRRNSIGVDQIGTVVSAITRAIKQAKKELAGEIVQAEVRPEPAEEQRTPAVPIKRSVQRDYLVCLEEGSKAKTLKRHLHVAHGLTPQQYRERWGLPRDYPMVAPAYREQRSAVAKQLGLGRKATANAESAAPTEAPATEAPKKRGRRSKAAA